MLCVSGAGVAHGQPLDLRVVDGRIPQAPHRLLGERAPHVAEEGDDRRAIRRAARESRR
jgi:hypothetical protein